MTSWVARNGVSAGQAAALSASFNRGPGFLPLRLRSVG
jgi:hypothetical protein